MDIRIGYGWDSHAFKPGVPLKIGGLRIEHPEGLAGHSDGDVLLHALTDALLGAVSAGDIGSFFPPGDPRWKDADSIIFLNLAMEEIQNAGYRVVNVDTTLVLNAPKIGPMAGEMRERVADLLGIAPANVGIKAKTPEGLGVDNVAQAHAVVLLERIEDPRRAADDVRGDAEPARAGRRGAGPGEPGPRRGGEAALRHGRHYLTLSPETSSGTRIEALRRVATLSVVGRSASGSQRQLGNHAAFAFRQKPELLGIRSAVEGAAQAIHGIGIAVVGESEGAVVNARRLLPRRGCDGLRRPAPGVMCTGPMNHSGAKAPMGSRASRTGPNWLRMRWKNGTESRIAGEVDVPRRALEQPSAPQGSIAIEGRARGEVLRGNAMDLEGSPWL